MALFTPLTIVIVLAIKGVEIPYKRLLCKNGYTLDGDGVSRSLSTMDIFWYITWQEVLFIKRFQFNVMCLLGLALRLLGTFLSPLGWLVRAIVGPTLSALNYDHGALIPEEAYLQNLERLRTEYPLLLILYIAGLMGADGNIGSGQWATLTRITQSNYPFLNALAQTMQRAFGFSDEPRVSCQERSGSRERDTFHCHFSAEQGEALILLVGSFDYNRRAQWLLTLIMRLVISAPDFPNKTNIREFIEDILIVIREEEPS